MPRRPPQCPALVEQDLARSGLTWAQCAPWCAAYNPHPIPAALHAALPQLRPGETEAVLLFQYHAWNPDGTLRPLKYEQFARGRMYWAPLVGFKKGAKDTRPKYLQKPGTGVQVYPAPNIDWAPYWNRDNRLPLVVVEGEKKALACAARGLHAIGLGGVNSIATRKDEELAPDLARAVADERDVYIVFDVDAGHTGLKPEVSSAAQALAQRVVNAGGVPSIIVLPRPLDAPLLTKWAIDDWLLHPAHAALTTPQLWQQLNRHGLPHDTAVQLLALDRQYVYIVESNAVGHRTTRYLSPVNAFRVEHGNVRVAVTELATVRGGTTVLPRQFAKPLGDAWLAYPQRAQAQHSDFYPGCYDAVTAEGEFNRWRGWACRPLPGATLATVRPFADALYLLHGEEDGLRMLRWYLYPLAYPEANKQFIIPILQSESQGVGKSLVPQLLGRYIYAPYFSQLHAESLKDARMEFASECMFLLLDDMKSLARHEPLLNYLATAENLQLNEKYVRSRQVRNTVNSIITTNATKPLDITDETRRFAVPFINAEQAKEHPHWNVLADWFKSGAGGPAVLGFAHTLRQRGDLDDYDPRAPAWRNARFEEMREMTRTDADDWVSDTLLRTAARDLVGFAEMYVAFHRVQLAAGATQWDSSPSALMKALNTVGRALGFGKRMVPFYDQGRQSNRSIYALRNAKHWLNQEHDAWRAEVARCPAFKGMGGHHKKY